MRKTWVWSLGQEDPLEKEMATHSSILAWRIPWTEKPGGLQSMGLQRVRHDWANSLSCYGKKMKSRGIAITSWQIDGETVETVTDFILGGSKITTDGDGNHEIKRCLFLGRKVMMNIESILKSRDITLPTNVRLVKAMVFPVVMYGCENWTIQKAEHHRVDAFGEDSWESLGLQRDPTSPF